MPCVGQGERREQEQWREGRAGSPGRVRRERGSQRQDCQPVGPGRGPGRESACAATRGTAPGSSSGSVCEHLVSSFRVHLLKAGLLCARLGVHQHSHYTGGSWARRSAVSQRESGLLIFKIRPLG